MGLKIVENAASRLNRERDRMIALWSHQHEAAQLLERELKELDDNLLVRFVDDGYHRAAVRDRVVGVVPGAWHVIRRHPGGDRGLDAWFPILGPHREPIEPGPYVVESMKRADLWRPGALEELHRKRTLQERRDERAAETEAEQRKDEFNASYRAAKRTPGDGGMTRRVAGKR